MIDFQTTPATEPIFVPPGVTVFPRSDRYTYVATIGQGGMGVIYRALDRELGHEVALKVLRARSHDAVARLKTEFRARADLHHPHLLQVLDLVVTADEAFFTMELVDAVDFLDWVWQAGESEAHPRLASALVGVVSALDALHRAGWVHFDVKPANILVDRSGRALLADFGLSTAIRSRAGEPARDLDGAGTPDYMGPERRRGGAVSPASDLYSVGAIIFEALTGSPHDDRDAQRDDPLLALARRLMISEPHDRPTVSETVDTLGGGATTRPAGAHRAAELPFVGRQPQMVELAEAFGRVAAATSVIAHVHGPSGIGKTVLICRFLDDLAASRRDALVLRGRCHPYEQIAFGGMDRVVDGLAECIRDGEVSVAGITATALAALVRLFPTLPWRVPATASPLSGDDRGLRLLGIATLRELLVRVAARRPLVIWIDDLHWVDDDTEQLLTAIANIPHAMMIYSYRGDAAARFAAPDGSDGSDAQAPVTHRVDLALAALEHGDLESLLRAIAPDLTDEVCGALASAAAGSPVFAHVLGRHDVDRSWAAGLGHAGSPGALWNQLIDALPARQRALFDAIVVAPGPVAAAIVRDAAGVEHASPELRALEQLGIVSRAHGRGAIRVAPFHDQLRRVRLAHLDASTHVRLHRELARSHERSSSEDYEALIHHFHELAENARAAHYAVLAGDRAGGSLAFGAAAAHYARAIEWLPDRAEPWELHRKLAECQANRGHSEDAGLHFDHAARARTAASDTGPDTTRLAMRAAEQLLHCGRIPDGYRIMRDVLARFRVRVPASHRAVLFQSVVLRARLALRGLEAVVRTDVPAQDELRMDVLWMASTSLAHVNHALAHVLLLHLVRAVLDGATPSRLSRLLAYEAAAEAALGVRYFDRRSAAMIAHAERLLADSHDDYDLGWFETSRSSIAFLRADWPGTIAHAEAAERHYLRRGIGVSWERAVLHSYWLFALALRGDARALDERRQLALDDALARRDRLAESHCRSGYTTLAWLFRDDLAAARRERTVRLGAVHRDDHERASTQRWPETAFGTPDYHALLADCHISLYAGEVEQAHARVEAAWPLIEGALLLHVQFVGVDLRFLRARCALAASRVAARPRALHKLALRERAKIARDPNPVARPYHALLSGLLAQASELFDEAARGFDALSMIAHAAAARFRRGEVLGGRDGARLQGEACDRLRAAGIACPERVIEMYAPAIRSPS